MRPLNISGSQAKDYYYAKDPAFSKNGDGLNSCWHGDAARALGLSGKIKKQDFLNIISGNDLGANNIIKDGVNNEHRAAVDIPFSAPKSVSVIALHVGDDRLTEAHEKAVAKTLESIEDNYVFARKTSNGITTVEKTGNGVFATFTHSTSRENDPQLHTHTLIMNMTEAKNGWRATWNDQIFKEQVLLNSVYQSELAKNVMDLGYQIESGQNGNWEIAGFKKPWVTNFSKRSAGIDVKEAELKEREVFPNANESERRNIAVLESRSDKDPSVLMSELKQIWQQDVPRAKIKKAVLKARGSFFTDQKSLTKLKPKDFIDLSAEVIHDKESTFFKKDILQTALCLSRGQCTFNQIEKSFLKALSSGQIVCVERLVNSKGLAHSIYTTPQMKDIESSILKQFDSGKGRVPALVKSPEIDRFVNAKYEWFTQDQKKVVAHMLSTRDRFCIIQGDAGTGKTSAMAAVKEIIKTNNLPCTIYGLGYTGKAAKELENQAGISSQTISSFLKNKADDLSPSSRSATQILIVDESSMVGSRQMKQLIDCADKNNARLFFVGDCKQLQAIQAGKVFKDLQDKDFVQAIKMGEVLRQKTDHMKQAVAAIKNYQEAKSASGVDEAFDILKTNEAVIEIKNDKKRFEQVAKEVSRGENYIDTLILTPKNEDRLALNNQIRNNLKKAGRLDDKDFSLTVKSPISLPGTSKYFAGSYHVGQKAFVDTGGKQFLGLRSGKEVEIVDTDKIKNTIRVKTFEGKQRQIDLKEHSSKLSVFRQDNKEFCRGDKIVFLKNDRRLKVQNGLTGSIEKIDHKGTLAVKLNQMDKTISFNTKTYGYFDHGYAVTVHKAQGQTSKNVILVADSKSPQLNKTEAFYVAMSRGTHSARIYTDDVGSLKTQFKEAQEKTSTLAGHRQAISAPGVKTNTVKKNRQTGRSK